MGTERREDQERKSQEEKDTETPFFVCRIVCLLAPFPLSSYLAGLPLTSSQRPLSFSISFVVLPPSRSLFTSFCLGGIYLEMIIPPPFLHLPPYSLLGLPFHLQAYLLPLSLHRSSLSFLPSITIKMVAVETGLFGNGGRKIMPLLCLSILMLPCA